MAAATGAPLLLVLRLAYWGQPVRRARGNHDQLPDVESLAVAPTPSFPGTGLLRYCSLNIFLRHFPIRAGGYFSQDLTFLKGFLIFNLSLRIKQM